VKYTWQRGLTREVSRARSVSSVSLFRQDFREPGRIKDVKEGIRRWTRRCPTKTWAKHFRWKLNVRARLSRAITAPVLARVQFPSNIRGRGRVWNSKFVASGYRTACSRPANILHDVTAICYSTDAQLGFCQTWGRISRPGQLHVCAANCVKTVSSVYIYSRFDEPFMRCIFAQMAKSETPRHSFGTCPDFYNISQTREKQISFTHSDTITKIKWLSPVSVYYIIELLFNIHEKNDFAERSKILDLDMDQKSNFVKLSK